MLEEQKAELDQMGEGSDNEPITKPLHATGLSGLGALHVCDPKAIGGGGSALDAHIARGKRGSTDKVHIASGHGETSHKPESVPKGKFSAMKARECESSPMRGRKRWQRRARVTVKQDLGEMQHGSSMMTQSSIATCPPPSTKSNSAKRGQNVLDTKANDMPKTADTPTSLHR